MRRPGADAGPGTAPAGAPAAELVRQVQALVEAYDTIGRQRMAGVPVMHPGLVVEAVGFERCDDGALGVLVTPWFMNLVWLPAGQVAQAWPVGSVRPRRIGAVTLDFLGAHEPGVGSHAACSLFSPMFEFADRAAARATAAEVLAQLRAAPAGAAAPDAAAAGTAPADVAPADRHVRTTPGTAVPQAAPARRAFLLGRASRPATRAGA